MQLSKESKIPLDWRGLFVIHLSARYVMLCRSYPPACPCPDHVGLFSNSKKKITRWCHSRIKYFGYQIQDTRADLCSKARGRAPPRLLGARNRAFRDGPYGEIERSGSLMASPWLQVMTSSTQRRSGFGQSASRGGKSNRVARFAHSFSLSNHEVSPASSLI